MSDILNQPGEVSPPANPVPTPAPAPPAPEPAPTPAPAAPPTPIDPIAPVEKVDTKGRVTFEPTGDAGLDIALDYFGGLGLGLDTPEMQEAINGNFQYLEAKIAALGEKGAGGEKYIGLAKAAHERHVQNETAAYEERKKVAYDAVGGEENWNKVQEFVTANAEPAELEAVKSAMATGGIVARAVAEMLHRQYMTASGTEIEPARPTVNQSTAPVGSGQLTLAGYREELNKLVAEVGSHRVNDDPRYARLRDKYKNATP